MLHYTIILADIIMVTTMIEDAWRVTCSDALTGKTCMGMWTQQQFNAVLALMGGVAEDKDMAYDWQALYAIAEPLFKDWPNEVRPIP